jgi:polyhydroxybutyrate depolymerase
VNATWNVGFFGTYGTGVDDVGFVSKMIDTLSGLYGIDLNRVYACGLSNGGYLSHRLACELNNRIAAIAAVSGTLTDSTAFYCTTTKKVPIMHIHGTADPIVAYTGVVSTLSVEQTIQFWLDKNSCSVPGDTTDLPDTAPLDSSNVQKIDYTHCLNSTEVLFYKITGGGHTWPGGLVDIPSFGPTNRDIDASTEIWNFFSRYSLSNPLGVEAPQKDLANVSVYPNPVSNYLRIESNELMTTLEIQNVVGERVLSLEISNTALEVDLGALSKGLYLLKVLGRDFSVTKKIYKE